MNSRKSESIKKFGKLLKKGRKSNFAKNSLGLLIQKVIKIGEQLLLIPFFINSWGAEYYGEWLTLTIIPSILALSDFGIGSSAANSFLISYIAKDYQKAANIRKMGMWIITITIVIVIILTLMALVFIYTKNLWVSDILKFRDGAISIIFLMIARILNFYSPLSEIVFRAEKRASYAFYLLAAFSAINLIGSLVVLLLRFDVVIYSFVLLVISIVFNVLFYLFAQNLLTSSLLSFKGKVVRSEVVVLVKTGFGYLLGPLWQVILFQGSTLAVRVVLGAEMVALYNTVRTASRSITQVFNIIENAMLPELQVEFARGNLIKVQHYFRRALIMTASLGFFGFVFLFIFGRQLYNFWTNSAFAINLSTWSLFILSVLLSSIWWVCVTLYWASNKPYLFTLPATVFAILSVLAVYILSLHYGIIGSVLGTLFFDIAMLLYLLPVSLNYIGINYTSFTKGLKKIFGYNQKYYDQD